MQNNFHALKDMRSRNLPMILYSLLIGLIAGLVIVAYRFALSYSEKMAFAIYEGLKGHGMAIIIWFAILVVAGFIVGKCIEKNDMIAGSGIPQVKGILMGYLKDNWFSTLAMKFAGGIMSILAGLSVGREGPSIQLGACVAEGVTKRMKCSRLEKKMLIAGGSCAGLAAAFNAPLAGVLFVFEEIFKYFSPLILLSAMGSAIVADFVSKQFFGLNPIFKFDVVGSLPLNDYWLLIVLGIILGLLGVVYNSTLIGIQKYYKKLSFLTPTRKVILTFLLAGVVGMTFPILLGSGHHITDILSVEMSFKFLILLLMFKFLFSVISFNSGVPGGIFFPLLVLGALIGAIFSKSAIAFLGVDTQFFYHFVVIAMAGYFTAIVRAPITGIVLIIEMTGSFAHLLPLTITSITAYVVADLLKCLPIYDSLLQNMLASKNLIVPTEEHNKKVMINIIVQYESPVVGQCVRDIAWPTRSLLVSVKHLEECLVPNGQTRLEAGDELIVLTDLNNEAQAREGLELLTTVGE